MWTYKNIVIIYSSKKVYSPKLLTKSYLEQNSSRRLLKKRSHYNRIDYSLGGNKKCEMAQYTLKYRLRKNEHSNKKTGNKQYQLSMSIDSRICRV